MHKTFQQTVTTPRNLVVGTFLVGVVGTIYGLSVSHPYATTLPPLITLGALAAAFVHRREYSFATASPSLPKRPLLSLYFVLVALTITSFAVTPGYGRTFPTHVLLVFVYVATVLTLFAFDSGPFKLVVLGATGVLHRALVYYGSATQLGLDALFHTRMAAGIVETGSLQPLAEAASKYWYSPASHLTVAVTGMLSGLPVRDAAFVAITAVATVVPILVAYRFLEPFWGERVASLGAFLFLVGDRAIGAAVHVTPTTFGFVLFAVAFFAGVRYLSTGYRPYYGLFLVVLLGQTFNHQVSLLVTIVGVGAYVGTRVLWNGEVTKRDLAFVPPLVGSGLYQGFMTKINGPSGELTIGDVVLRNFRRSLPSGGGAAAPQLPESVDAVIGGTASLSSIHALGLALLFGMSVLGTIYWIGEIQSPDQDFVFSLCGTVLAMSAFVFIPPMVGIHVFFSLRWMTFLYLCLAVLAAPGIAILLSAGATQFRSSRRKQLLALVLTVVVVVAPYTALMAWNYPGAIDGPVFDSSPGAQRLTATSTEVAAYTHVDQYGQANAIFADKAARQMIERHYGHPAANYQIEYGTAHPVQTENVLVVDRAYARTDHAQYFINYRDRWVQVYGSLPVERTEYSVVYSTGGAQEDRILYHE